VIYNPSADRSLTGSSTGRIVAVTDVTCWAGADAIAFITARDASLRRNAWTTRTAVFRARASIMVARPHLPSYATATSAGLVLVARRVSFTTCEIPFKSFSCHWPLGHLGTSRCWSRAERKHISREAPAKRCFDPFQREFSLFQRPNWSAQLLILLMILMKCKIEWEDQDVTALRCNRSCNCSYLH
jgi:hypothetical protein